MTVPLEGIGLFLLMKPPYRAPPYCPISGFEASLILQLSIESLIEIIVGVGDGAGVDKDVGVSDGEGLGAGDTD